MKLVLLFALLQLTPVRPLPVPLPLSRSQQARLEAAALPLREAERQRDHHAYNVGLANFNAVCAQLKQEIHAPAGSRCDMRTATIRAAH